MWRYCICLLLVIPFILLPLIWFTFPSSCEDGHIHYAEGHEHDTNVSEPWHCHIPRHTGWACTPNIDCCSGGMYGPTTNGALFLLVIFAGLFGLFFFSSDSSHEIAYVTNPERRFVSTRARKRGLEHYPIR